MDNKINTKQLSANIIKYFNKKEAWDYEFQRYSVIKKSIIYVTKLKKIYLIRKLFLLLVEEGYFIKKQNNNVRSYLYKFKNPNNPKIEAKKITINFN